MIKRIIALILLLALPVIAADIQFYPFPFVGKWNPTEDPMLVDDYGFQDVQNVRKDGKHFKGVNGHTKVNTSATTDSYVVNGFHFIKDQPSESHVIIYGVDSSTPSSGHLYQNTTAIPGQGNFSTLYSPTSVTNTFRFSNAPQGNMVSSNAAETLIWGGNEMPITAFFTSTASIDYTLTNAADYTEELTNSTSGTNQTATLTGGGTNHFVIGTTRPLQGVKFYVSTGNSTDSTIESWEWQTSAWVALTETDGTRPAAKSMAQTGSVTWTATNLATPRYLNGLSLYWYKFKLSAGGTTLYYVTADAPIQSIKNVWDGVESMAASAWGYKDADYTNYTAELGDNDDNTVAVLSSYDDDSTDYFYAGFTEKQQGVNIRVTKRNDIDGTVVIDYWNGTAWTNVSGMNDGTFSNNQSLDKASLITWTPLGIEEKKRQLNDDYPLYWYRFRWADSLDTSTEISEIRGLPCPQQITSTYKFSQMFQSRLFLFNETGRSKNKALYSVYNSADIWNGEDSGELYFGDDTELTAAVSIYNVFNSSGGIEQLILTKKNETYRLTGIDAKTWSIQRISTNVGCIAPLSLVSADITELDNNKRQVAIWASDKGVYMSDGATVREISQNIATYWNPASSSYIPVSMQSRSFGWYDPLTYSYKLLIASGSTATFLNTELEYSLKHNEWTKISRTASTVANPLQSGWKVYDTNGVTYTYGGAKNGYVYRLENGNNWDGDSITSYLWTKDIILDQQAPLARLSTVKHMRLTHKKKSSGDLTITHYGDGSLTTSGTNGQMGPANITSANFLAHYLDTQSLILGPALTHSFKFSETTNVAGGLELTGLGIWFEPYTLIRQ
jgi:hypothetical protein